MDIFLDNHVSMKIKRGGPVRRNIQKQKVTNAPIVKPQGEVINAKFLHLGSCGRLVNKEDFDKKGLTLQGFMSSCGLINKVLLV